jgi:protoporphyrinogen oxidase
VEIPCYATDEIWQAKDDDLIEQITTQLQTIGWIKRSDLLGGAVLRLSHAYPVLEAGSEVRIEKLLGYLRGFANLRVIGRNGRFVYKHVHDMLRFGHDAIEELSGVRD